MSVVIIVTGAVFGLGITVAGAYAGYSFLSKNFITSAAFGFFDTVIANIFQRGESNDSGESCSKKSNAFENIVGEGVDDLVDKVNSKKQQAMDSLDEELKESKNRIYSTEQELKKINAQGERLEKERQERRAARKNRTNTCEFFTGKNNDTDTGVDPVRNLSMFSFLTGWLQPECDKEPAVNISNRLLR